MIMEISRFLADALRMNHDRVHALQGQYGVLGQLRSHRAEMALAPQPAPSRAPAIAAVVSVSSPIRTTAANASARCWHLSWPVRGGVCTTADQAACSAVTQKPFCGKGDAGRDQASSR
jgi:hypothetical protein